MNTQHVEDNHEVVLVEGLCAKSIDKRLRKVCRLTDVGHRATAFYLADLHTRGLHQALGMPTTVTYAVRSLGMRRRSARQLLDAGLHLQELTRIDAAFAACELTWSRVRCLCEVATPATEEAWLERAMTGTQDELEHLVRGVHRGDAPPSGGGLPRARFTLHTELDAVEWALFENARAKLQAELGNGDELRIADVIAEMARLVLASKADGTVPGRTPVEDGPFRVLAREGDASSAPALLTPDGEEALTEARFDAIASTGATPPWLRAKVLARDGHACKNCGSRRALHAHHVVWRSQGGPTVLENLLSLCNRCHGLVHGGFLQVEVAQRATEGRNRVDFVFLDGHGRRVDRRSCGGARVTLRAAEAPEVAQGATSAAPAPPIDVRWLAAHLDWFDARGGGFTLKPQFRQRFEQDLATRTARSPETSSVA